MKLVYNYFFSGHQRSLQIKKNIIITLLIKGFSIVISLILVPLTLGYLDTYEYGIWLIISSILLWIDFCDLGLGNGLRNKLSTSLAKGDHELSKILVSTTFFSLLLIILGLLGVFLLVNPYIDWYSALNVEKILVPDLNRVILVSFLCVGLTFIFKITQNVFFALQLPMFNSLILLVGQLLALSVIYVLSLYTKGNLFSVALVLSASPAIALIIAYPITFYYLYPFLRPSFKTIQFKYFKPLFGLGIKFFFLQLGSLLIFATSNIIISRVINPAEVTPYNMAYKYFNTVNMIFYIMITPLWSAVTEAYAKGDMVWIKHVMNRMLKICYLSFAALLFMLICSSFIYHVWIGDKVQIPWMLNILAAVYIAIINYSICYSTFIFGIGKLQLQLYNTAFAGVLFIILAVVLGRELGITGVMLSLCLANLSGAILNPIQFYKIISGKSYGIWSE